MKPRLLIRTDDVTAQLGYNVFISKQLCDEFKNALLNDRTNRFAVLRAYIPVLSQIESIIRVKSPISFRGKGNVDG